MLSDLVTFRTVLRLSILKHYAKSKEELEGLYGYALYSGDDLSSVGGVCNCEADIPVAESDEMYDYYRYGVVEWQHFDDSGFFDEANALLKRIMDCDANEWGERKEQVLEVCFEAMLSLESERLFGAKDLGRFIVICLADSDHPIMDRSAKAMNAPEVYEKYSKEFAT